MDLHSSVSIGEMANRSAIQPQPRDSEVFYYFGVKLSRTGETRLVNEGEYYLMPVQWYNTAAARGWVASDPVLHAQGPVPVPVEILKQSTDEEVSS